MRFDSGKLYLRQDVSGPPDQPQRYCEWRDPNGSERSKRKSGGFVLAPTELFFKSSI